MADGNSIPSRLSRAPLHVVSGGYTPAREPAPWWQVVGAVTGWCVFLAGVVGALLPILDHVLKVPH